MAGGVGLFDLANTMQAFCIEMAAKKGVPPVRYVLERFLGEKNQYNVNFSESGLDNTGWPDSLNQTYSGDEIVKDAKQTVMEYNETLKSQKGEGNYISLEIEEALLEDGTLVGYYLIGPDVREVKRDEGPIALFRESIGYEVPKQSITRVYLAFCPIASQIEVCCYLMEFDKKFELIPEILVASREGRTSEEILESIKDRPESKKFVDRKKVILEGVSETYGVDPIDRFNSLISYCAGLGGKPIFEGQQTDDTGLGVLSQVPKEISIWQIFAKEGSKQKDFDTYIKYALEAEPI